MKTSKSDSPQEPTDAALRGPNTEAAGQATVQAPPAGEDTFKPQKPSSLTSGNSSNKKKSSIEELPGTGGGGGQLALPAAGPTPNRRSRAGLLCPEAFGILLQHKIDYQKGLGLKARCKCWACPVCHDWQIEVWREAIIPNLIQYQTLYASWVPQTPSAAWNTVRERIRVARGKYGRVKHPSGRYLVISTTPASGGRPVSSAAAVRAFEAILAAIPLQKGPHLSASRGWGPSSIRSRLWRRKARVADLQQALDMLKAMGVRLTELPAPALNDLYRKVLLDFPRGWGKLQVATAFGVAGTAGLPAGAPSPTQQPAPSPPSSGATASSPVLVPGGGSGSRP
jgi:hypothetical protein